MGARLVVIGTLISAFFMYLFLRDISQGLMLPGGSGRPGDASTCEMRAELPGMVLRWCELIDRYAAEHGLDAGLVAAVVWLESGGDPRAYSTSGAVGLMQVMPRDGLAEQFMCIAGPCFSNRPTMEQLEDAEFNISFGTRMLAGLIKRTGNPREALKAYGPMDVGYSYADRVLAIYYRLVDESNAR